MHWKVIESCFDHSNIEKNGSKFLLGNGYMGFRGTLEEYTKEQLVAVNLAGIYDRVGASWREPINAPNGFFLKVSVRDIFLDVLSGTVLQHEQVLDFKTAVHSRTTVYDLKDQGIVTMRIDRFLSMDKVHLMCMKASIVSSKDCTVTIQTGIDGDVWDLHGPHLINHSKDSIEGILLYESQTQEAHTKISVAEAMSGHGINESIECREKAILRKFDINIKAGQEVTFSKYASVYTGNDPVEDPSDAAANLCRNAQADGYDKLLGAHCEKWAQRWAMSDVQIEGDDEAQHALRYSIYHLLAIAPTHTDKASIPARGLSGQVYKGAIFWDTEMFMLPFFISTNPALARNLLKYRIHTLEGARRKAKEFGFRGAFYAWESQDNGDDGCPLFVFTDVFSNRPMRNHFRDRQVHISADVVLGLWNYYRLTGDVSILLEGGAEVILECARFFVSYAYFKKDKRQYEILDVIGPDEYHEASNNNAFTNRMVKFTVETALNVLELFKSNYPEQYKELIEKLDFSEDIAFIEEVHSLLYLPEPDTETLVIEQFDGYHKLEDVSLDDLKKRILIPGEYLGGGNGIATHTKIIKQADVILMLHLFGDSYAPEVLQANWEYYEPRTEHGSSLSPCVYAMVAARINKIRWAYKYFMRTACIDLKGDSKQYVGNVYIGGTHPAANGGAWMAAILGFAGLKYGEDRILLSPRLPENWSSLSFQVVYKGQAIKICIDAEKAAITSDTSNTQAILVSINNSTLKCEPGQCAISKY